MDAITELEWRRRMDAARRQQMDTGYRARTPGYSEYASGALGDVATVENLSNTGFPIVSDAADAALATDAARRGNWGEAALYGTALALPFVSGPVLKTGFDVVGRKLGKVGDVPYDPNLVDLELFRRGMPGRGYTSVIEDIPAPVWNKNAMSVPVGINPTKSELAELRRSDPSGVLRLLEPKDPEREWYLWPFDQALHSDVGAHYGLNPKDYYHSIIE